MTWLYSGQVVHPPWHQLILPKPKQLSLQFVIAEKPRDIVPMQPPVQASKQQRIADIARLKRQGTEL
ncbi:hypothetical protein MACH17_31130 [Phaeobacter inhibens]|nr:hypothetical protein MACH17_31130 [Phaeobacter inhibens]